MCANQCNNTVNFAYNGHRLLDIIAYKCNFPLDRSDLSAIRSNLHGLVIVLSSGVYSTSFNVCVYYKKMFSMLPNLLLL